MAADFPDLKSLLEAQTDPETRAIMELVGEHLFPPLLTFLYGRHYGSTNHARFTNDLVTVISSLSATMYANAIPANARNEEINRFCTRITEAMQRGKLQ